MIKLYQNRDWLEKKYINEKLSDLKIAKLCKVDHNTIWYWRKKFNIATRPQGEAIHLANGNHCSLSQEAVEWIDGELLGDAYLAPSSNYSAQIYYTSKFLEYCEYIKDVLKSFGIYQIGKIYKYSLYYYYYSKRYAELLPLRKKWYPKGKKIVPKDLKLTSLTCRQWYIGDGSLVHTIDSKPCIQLYTCGFPIFDVEWLKEQLIELSFKVTRESSENIIRISTKSTKDFLNYIGPCPVECYQYKWDYYKRGGIIKNVNV